MILKVECQSCDATGIYKGFMEREGEGVVCVNCRGSGCITFKYKPFAKRKKRKGINRIRVGSGLILDKPRTESWFSYEEFEKRFKEK